MQVQIIPNTTKITEIITNYITTLKIDDTYEVEISIIEFLTDLDNNEKSNKDLKIDIQTYPENIDNSNVIDYVTNIERFVEENIDKILAEIKS